MFLTVRGCGGFNPGIGAKAAHPGAFMEISTKTKRKDRQSSHFRMSV